MNAKKLTALLISVFMLLQMCVISVSAETDSDTAASDIVTETDESSESGDAAETEASAITAATDRGAVANAEAGTITVDGSKDDAYASVTPIEVKYIDDVPVADLTDGTANVYLMTNNGLLYVYGEINDTNPLTPDAEAQANWPWDTDSPELFIDPNGDAYDNIYQFRIDNSGYPSFYMNWNGVMSAYGPEAAKDYFVSYADGERNGGYTVEFCIDLKNFGVCANTKLGINFQLNDRDSDENGEISQRAIYNGIAGSFDSYDYDYVTIGAGETYEAVGEPVPSSGTCGENLTWTLVDGVLTISGTGDMYDYDSTHWDYYPNVEPAPWQGQTVT
ncbi:MAG: hypothetical protein IJW77_15370, partial [Clostridia bacterium]|nr:hypothetical protein [Clostridia bacterium]